MKKRWVKLAVLGVLLVLGGAIGAELLNAGKKPEARPGIAGQSLQGKRWDLQDHLGKRPVLVSFFATWCGPCRQEVPELMEMQAKFRDRGLELVLLSEEDEATLRSAGLHEAPMPVLAKMTPVFTSYGVEGIPRTLYFNRSGKLAKDMEGYDPASLEAISRELEALPVAAAR